MKKIKGKSNDIELKLRELIWSYSDNHKTSDVIEVIMPILFLRYLKSLSKDNIKKKSIHIPQPLCWDNIISAKPSFRHLYDKLYEFEKFNPYFYNVFASLQYAQLDIVQQRYLIDTIDSFYTDNAIVSFSQAFDILLEIYEESMGKMGNVFSQPKELTELVNYFIPSEKGIDVYNPFAGVASYAINLPKGSTYYGQELNQKTWAIAKLRIFINGLAKNSTIKAENSVYEWNHSSKFDLIVSTPPFGASIIGGQVNSSQKNLEAFAIERSISTLTNDGKAIFIVRNGFLFGSNHERQLRKHIIDNDLLDTVISFPGGIFQNTGIKFSIIILNKNKRRKGNVLFIDGETFFTKKTKANIIDIDRVIQEIEFEGTSQYKVISSNDEIKSNECDFSPNRYLIREILTNRFPNSNFIELGELITPLRTARSQTKDGKLVKIGDLANSFQNYEKTYNGLNIQELKNSFSIDKKECLAVSLRHRDLKPTYIVDIENDIFLSLNINVFEINKEKIDVAYLVNELYSDYVQNQLDKYRIGTSISQIRRNDFLRIKVELPAIEQQRAKIKGVRETIVALKLQEAGRIARDHGIENIIFESLASLKHSMGKPLLNINSGVKNMKGAIERLNNEGEQVTLDSKISKRHSLSLKDSFRLIEKELNFISNLLEDNENELDPSGYKLSSINIFDLLIDLKKKESLNENKFRLEYDFAPDIKSIYNNTILIYGNTELLTVLFNNIIDNVNRHGFAKFESKNMLTISLGVETMKTGTIVKIIFKNNGASLPNGYNKSMFIRKNSKAGDTGNTGIGGYDINNIINHFEGSFDLYSIPGDIFKTIYSFEFKLINESTNDE